MGSEMCIRDRDYGRPTTVKQLRRFNGLVSSLAVHLPHLFDMMRPLRRAASGSGKLQWTDEMEVAFEQAKEGVTSDLVVVPFDDSREPIVLTDYSKDGMSAAIVYVSADKTHFELVDCLSHNNSVAESKYSPQSGELAAFRLAVRKWPHWLKCRHIFWLTDCAPMASALSGSSPSVSGRIDRTLAELQGLDVTVIKSPGKLNVIADALSRDPSFVSEVADLVHPPVVTAPVVLDEDEDAVALPSESSLVQLLHREETSEQCVARWKQAQLDDDSLKTMRDDADGDGEVARWHPHSKLLCVLNDDKELCVVVPHELRLEVLVELHCSHMQEKPMIAKAKRYLWWDRMLKDIRQWFAQCVVCQRVRRTRLAGNLGDSEQHGAPERLEAWQIDTLHLGKQLYMVAVELFSGFIFTHKLVAGDSESMRRAMFAIFRIFSTPRWIQTDGGKEFFGAVKRMCVEQNVEIRRGIAYNSRSQSRVERANRSLQDAIARVRTARPGLEMEDIMAIATRDCNAIPSSDKWKVSAFELLLGKVPNWSLACQLQLERAVSHTDVVASIVGEDEVDDDDDVDREEVTWISQMRDDEAARSDMDEVRQLKHDAQRARTEKYWNQRTVSSRSCDVGDLVWLENWDSNPLKAKDRRRHDTSGPWLVESVNGDREEVTIVWFGASERARPFTRKRVHMRRVRLYVEPVVNDKYVPQDLLEAAKKALKTDEQLAQKVFLPQPLSNLIAKAEKRAAGLVRAELLAQQRSDEAAERAPLVAQQQLMAADVRWDKQEARRQKRLAQESAGREEARALEGLRLNEERLRMRMQEVRQQRDELLDKRADQVVEPLELENVLVVQFVKAHRTTVDGVDQLLVILRGGEQRWIDRSILMEKRGAAYKVRAYERQRRQRQRQQLVSNTSSNNNSSSSSSSTSSTVPLGLTDDI